MSLKRPTIIMPFALALTALLGFSATAQMQDKMSKMQDEMPMNHEMPMHHGMMKMDTDGDGAVSRDEFLAHHKSRFAKVDTDGDGVISDEEKQAAREAHKAKMAEHHAKMQERRKKHHEEMKARYDANKDGKLDASEREAMASDRFSKMDKNGDGVLSADEMPMHGYGRQEEKH
ncbi:MAG: EF-hand domain-containing protein [Sphingomonadales bacterium]|jgi:Ca2+-binding EF-hand superfamily protein